jgi:hypothetical protein
VSENRTDDPNSSPEYLAIPEAHIRIRANSPPAAKGGNSNARIRAKAVKNSPSARIRAENAPAQNDNGPARIRAEQPPIGIHRHCSGVNSVKSRGFACDMPEAPAKGPVCRIVTNIPGQIPVLSAEIALLETYWGAILDLMAANDNEPD